MNLFHAFLLGILQGLTEFIPVSSTAHLLIGQTLLGLPANDAMFAFLVIVQLGTLVSLFILYWKDLLTIAQATLNFRSPTPARNLGLYLIIATIPALLAGYLLKDAVEALFKTPLLEAAIRLFTAALLLALAECLTRKNRQLDSLTWLDALLIGLMQIIAIFPGASRSGTTISGGLSAASTAPPRRVSPS
jgi:undecaprenyl-diphosphatase